MTEYLQIYISSKTSTSSLIYIYYSKRGYFCEWKLLRNRILDISRGGNFCDLANSDLVLPLYG